MRVVLAMAAFGMGIDLQDIRKVKHIGPPNDIEGYVQEISRREGSVCEAILQAKKLTRT